jgi:hypothetical protein
MEFSINLGHRLVCSLNYAHIADNCQGTNVVELHSLISVDPSQKQLTYYDCATGAYNSSKHWLRRVENTLDRAMGWCSSTFLLAQVFVPTVSTGISRKPFSTHIYGFASITSPETKYSSSVGIQFPLVRPSLTRSTRFFSRCPPSANSCRHDRQGTKTFSPTSLIP